jgi:Uncharacterized conserved protein
LGVETAFIIGPIGDKTKTKIILSSTFQERYGKFNHFFKYKVPSIFLDLEELETIQARSKIFSINSFNIFPFKEKEQGYRDNRSIKEFITQSLKNYKIKFNNLKIKILGFPRILGYVFNPLSILYGYEEDKLISICHEVKNTTKEQHTEVSAKDTYIDQSTKKHGGNKD